VEKTYYVYILASKPNGTLYIGVTSDLIRRIYEHKNKIVDGFTSKYNVDRLVYFEAGTDAEGAISREKELKRWRRSWKIQLIGSKNPSWKDLYPQLLGNC
jgi:putative endonuclease